MKKIRMCLLTLALTVPAVMAPIPASAKVLNSRQPFTLLVVDSCTGETVTVTGEIHRVVRSRVDNDGVTHLDIHVDSHGEGVGNSSGTAYVWNDSSDRSTDNPPGCEFSFSFVRYARLISRGSDDNRMLKITFGFNFDANCTLSFGDTFNLSCNG